VTVIVYENAVPVVTVAGPVFSRVSEGPDGAGPQAFVGE
jgi:hypothetical protein